VDQQRQLHEPRRRARPERRAAGGLGTFTIPREPVRRRIHGIDTFNVLRGGEYFFLPSLSALRWIADPPTDLPQ
jgi:hypothetical protein